MKEIVSVLWQWHQPELNGMDCAHGAVWGVSRQSIAYVLPQIQYQQT